MTKQLVRATLVILTLLFLSPSAEAAEPGWSPVIIATGDYRAQLQSTPIHVRPYRPFHFYGNAVRRRYHRGSALTVPRPVPGVFAGLRVRTVR